MSYHIAKPSKKLMPFIKQFWGVQNCTGPGTQSTMRIVPCGLPELTFYFGDEPKIQSPGKQYPGRSFFSGQQQGFYDIEIPSNLHMFAITFQPAALLPLCKLPVNELLNNYVSLNDLLRNDANVLEQRLFEAADFEQRTRITEEFIEKKLCANISDYALARIEDSMQHIHSFRGRIGLDVLASKACLSRKQYERTFLKYVGIPPGQFLKIIRFQHAVYLRQKKYGKSFTSLAYECGYFDQAHMNNDFKQLTGLTPRQFFADCDAYSDYFS